MTLVKFVCKSPGQYCSLSPCVVSFEDKEPDYVAPPLYCPYGFIEKKNGCTWERVFE